MELPGAVAVVTGGASGIGLSTARGLAEAGATVVLFDRDVRRGEQAAGDIGAHFIPVDVTDEVSVAAGLSEVVGATGRIDALVNCAGIATAERTLGRDGPHRDESFRRTLDINLTGSFTCARLASEIMAKNSPGSDGARGAIVLTASIAAFEGQKGQVAYAASKGGVAAMVLPMARDLATLGIRVNAIAPGVFLTPMLEGLGAEVQAALAADVVFPKRLGDPAEFAALVRFLLTCGYMNGTTIRIDGALRMG
jgi:NAD(P)-dependent dehydrogenase (short-subunit alcohol dehydrogenase family)